MDENTLEILKTINSKVDVKMLSLGIAQEIISKGLSYRQACALLEYTKDLLQDATLK